MSDPSKAGNSVHELLVRLPCCFVADTAKHGSGSTDRRSETEACSLQKGVRTPNELKQRGQTMKRLASVPSVV